MNGAVRKLRDVGPAYERGLAILERLHAENPEAIEDFLAWASRPRHTQSVTLAWHGGRLKCARFETTSKTPGT